MKNLSEGKECLAKNIVFMTYSGGFALLIIHLTYGLDLLEKE